MGDRAAALNRVQHLEVVAYVALDKLKGSTAGRRERLGPGEILAVTAAEVVENPHAPAGTEQVADDVRADEAGAAGDENWARCSSPVP